MHDRRGDASDSRTPRFPDSLPKPETSAMPPNPSMAPALPATPTGAARPVLLERGLVVDGTGGPSWPGDVLLEGDRIVAMGEGLRARLQRNEEGRGQPLDHKTICAIGLWRLKEAQQSYKAIGALFGVGKATARLATVQFVTAVREVYKDEYVHLPASEDEWAATQAQREVSWRL